MEVLEEANRALVESCNGFLDSMSQPKDKVNIRNAMVRASDALFNANRFSSMVSTCRGHARFRRAPKTETPFSQNISPDCVFPKTGDKSDGNVTKNFLESNSLNDSSAKTVSLAETSPAKDPHFLQPVKFHQDLNAEPCLSPKSSVCLDLSSNGKFKSSQSPFHPNLNAEPGLCSKSSECLDLSSNGKSSPGPFDQNLNAEPGFSSKSSVCWDLSSNGKSRHSMFHQNPNAELGSSSKNSMCLDLSSNGKFHPSIFHRHPNAELGLSSKTPMCLDLSSYGKYRPGIFHQNAYAEPGSSSKSSVSLNLSSNGKPPLHRSPFQFHQQLKNQQQYEQLSYQQQMKHRAEMMSRSQINLGNSFHNPAMSSSRSLVSSMSIDGSVTNTRPLSLDSLHLKRKCSGFGGDGSVHCGSNAPSGSRCHCAKKRRNKFRKIIIVPAISNKISDIPQDEYSWRKYGQKPIKNSDHPRGYYKCSVYKGCPAKKRVERCTDDPTKLRITHENDHNHPVGASYAHSA